MRIGGVGGTMARGLNRIINVLLNVGISGIVGPLSVRQIDDKLHRVAERPWPMVISHGARAENLF